MVGSGKGVASVKTIKQIGWKRKNLKKFKVLSKYYREAINKKCNHIDFNNMKDPNNPCLFCDIKKSGCAHENELAYASYDSYPVSEHHCLVIPKRHIKDYFDLTNEELLACNNLN